jgi:hypothetical protein
MEPQPQLPCNPLCQWQYGQLEKENAKLCARIAELEQQVTGLDGALERAVDKYTATFRLTDHTSEPTSLCTLIFAGLLLLGAYCIPWLL